MSCSSVDLHVQQQQKIEKLEDAHFEVVASPFIILFEQLQFNKKKNLI